LAVGWGSRKRLPIFFAVIICTSILGVSFAVLLTVAIVFMLLIVPLCGRHEKRTVYLYRPATSYPENIISLENTLQILKTFYPKEDNEKIRSIVENTLVRRRNIIVPFEELWQNHDPAWRHQVYMQGSRTLGKKAAREALENAQLRPEEVNMIIVTSCTGFAFPSLCAFLINDLELKETCRQLPIAQLGCAAGTIAIQQGADFIRANPGSNVLIVNIELCSMLYQKEDTDLASLICDGLFGDAATATVLRSVPTPSRRLAVKLKDYQFQMLLRNSTELLYYDVDASGFHFRLDKRLHGAIAASGPAMKQFALTHGVEYQHMDSYVLHTGGPKVLKEVASCLDIPQPESVCSSCIESLQHHGNTASCMIYDILAREFDKRKQGDEVMIGSFGPGFTVALSFGLFTRD